MIFDFIDFFADPHPHSAWLNMAIDEVLLHHIEAPALRVYRWSSPALSLGYFEKFGSIKPGSGGREIVRRWTGGGVVAHGEDFTYSILAPRSSPFCRIRPLESYRRIHDCISKLLVEFGVAGRLAPAASPHSSSSCFDSNAAHDILLGAIKIAGAAQRRTPEGLLHQGSIQHARLPEEFTTRLPCSLAGSVRKLDLGRTVLEEAAELAAEKYQTPAWTRRY